VQKAPFDSMSETKVRWVASAVAVPDELWQAAFGPPLEGRWWYRSLEHAGVDDQFRFAYGVVERGGHPIGIVPTFLMDVPIDLVAPPLVARVLRAGGRFMSRLRYQRTLFVGSPCSDEGTVGLIPGESLGSVAEVVQDALERSALAAGASMIVWKDFPKEDDGALEALSTARGLFRSVSFPGTRVRLRGSSFDDYLMALKTPKRHRLRRSLRRGREACPLETTVAANPGRAEIDEIFGLFWQTYEHGKTKFERLTREFFAAIAAEPQAHFVLMRRAENGRLAAFMLLFLSGRRVINKFIGLDYQLGREAKLYFQLWEQAVRFAYSVGAEEIQSGQTGYPVKLDIGHELVPLTNWCKHENPLVHRLFAVVSSRITWASLDPDLGDGYSSRATD
jgi:hypothetical protein